jgi:hypothetical protein
MAAADFARGVRLIPGVLFESLGPAHATVIPNQLI